MVIAVLETMLAPRHAIRRNAGRGFTLLEIMVVIALISSNTEDSWGTDYRIVCESTSVDAISAGRDRTFCTSDDVKSDAPSSR